MQTTLLIAAIVIGAIFTVYYYPEGARIPKEDLTLAKEVSKTYAVIDNPTYSRPRYAMMRELVNSSIYFVDCNKKQKDGLCRPEQPLTKKRNRGYEESRDERSREAIRQLKAKRASEDGGEGFLNSFRKERWETANSE